MALTAQGVNNIPQQIEAIFTALNTTATDMHIAKRAKQITVEIQSTKGRAIVQHTQYQKLGNMILRHQT